MATPIINYPLRLPAEKHQAAAAAAKLQGRPLAAWLEEAVTEKLEREESNGDDAEQCA